MEYDRQHKARLRFGIVAVLSLFLFYTLSPLLTRTVAAATPTYAAMNPQDQAKSYVLYYAMLQCFAGVNSINNGDVIAGAVAGINGKNSVPSWFLDKAIGDGGDGKVECGTAEKAAQTLWGYASFDDMLVSFGYKNPGGGGDWTNDSPGATIGRSLRERVFAGSNPALQDDEMFLYFRGTLEAACEISSPVDYATAPSSIKSAADSGTKYVRLTEPTADYKGTVEKIYTVGAWKTLASTLFPSNTPSPPNDNLIDCRDIAKIASAKAKAYASWAVLNATQAKAIDSTSTSGSAGTAKATTTCSSSIGGVGWIVCPVMKFLGTVNDGMFSFLGSSFLQIHPKLFDTNSGTYVAWGIFRNYANVAFVIVFMVIIYSQVTGAGVNNYGIKRMLPRLVIAAILVNISYFVCQAAVDLSNILGFSIKNLLDSIPTASGSNAKLPTLQNVMGFILAGVGLTAAVIAVLLAVSTSVVIACLIALAMIVLILVVREAAIVMLIVLSPLAFVAYLLPNTEGWFKKWYKMFSTLLMVFPIIAFVFGGSMLAARIINSAAASDNSQAGLILQLTAIGMAAIPLFIVPGILKGAVAATGAIGAKLQGYGNKATSRVSGGAKKNVAESKLGQFNQYRQQQSRIRNAKRLGGVNPYKTGGAANPLNWSARANRAFNNSSVSGNFGQNAANSGVEIERQEFEKNVKSAESAYEGMSSSDLYDMARNGLAKDGKKLDEASHTAAMRKVMKDGNHEQRLEMVMNSGAIESDRVRESIRDGAYAKGMNAYLGGGIGDSVMARKINSEADIDQKIAETAQAGKISADSLVSDSTVVNRIAKVLEDSESGARSFNLERVDPVTGAAVATTKIDRARVDGIKAAAATAKTSPATKSRIAGNMEGAFTTISTL